MIKYGVLIQGSIFIFTLIQSFMLPLFFDVNNYGAYIIYSAPIFIIAAIYEPYTQKDLISNNNHGNFYLFEYLLSKERRFIFLVIFIVFVIMELVNLNKYSIMLIMSGLTYFLFIITCSYYYSINNVKRVFILYLLQSITYILALLLFINIGLKALDVMIYSFLLSQISPMIGYYFFSLIDYNEKSTVIKIKKENGFIVLADTICWRGILIYLNPLLFWGLSFKTSMSVSDIGFYKVLFSIILLFKVFFPVNMPMFLSLIKMGDFHRVKKILLLQFFYYILAMALVYAIYPYIINFIDDGYYNNKYSFDLYFCVFGVLFLLAPSINAILSVVADSNKIYIDLLTVILLIILNCLPISFTLSLFLVIIFYYTLCLFLFFRNKYERNKTI